MIPEAETVDVEPDTDPNCDEDLVEVGGYMAKESTDVTLALNLTEVQKAEFMNCVDQFSSLFTEAPGTTNLIEHHINLTTEDPVRSKSYPLPCSMREELKKAIDDMIKRGVIRESTSPYSSRIVVMKKKDNTKRVCLDYQKLNKLTVVDPEPIPTAGKLFHKFSGDKYPEEDRHKTTFVTPDASYEFLKMSFGIVNSAATLKCCMKKLIDDFYNVDYYWDDITVHTPT